MGKSVRQKKKTRQSSLSNIQIYAYGGYSCNFNLDLSLYLYLTHLVTYIKKKQRDTQNIAKKG